MGFVPFDVAMRGRGAAIGDCAVRNSILAHSVRVGLCCVDGSAIGVCSYIQPILAGTANGGAECGSSSGVHRVSRIGVGYRTLPRGEFLAVACANLDHGSSSFPAARLVGMDCRATHAQAGRVPCARGLAEARVRFGGAAPCSENGGIIGNMLGGHTGGDRLFAPGDTCAGGSANVHAG